MFETTEKKITPKGNISYWKDGVLIGKRCTKCGKDKEISEFSFHNKAKKIYQAWCKECKKEYHKENREEILKKKKQYYEEHKEEMLKKGKEWRATNKVKMREYRKKWREKNPEYRKQHYKENEERYKERGKRWHEANKDRLKIERKEYFEKYYSENRELVRERGRISKAKRKMKNIQELTEMLKQVNPLLKELKAYGSIYKITNVKTGHIYIGQTTMHLQKRYRSNIIKGWIEEKHERCNQKFVDELIEENLVIEIIDVGVCQYHLDKLESHYINYYNSCDNGYNNNYGNYKSNDGIEEFEQILKENGLQFIDGKLVKIA